MWTKLVARKVSKPNAWNSELDFEYEVFTLRPKRSWGTYRREHDEMIRIEGPGPHHSAESFHQSLVDDWS